MQIIFNNENNCKIFGSIYYLDQAMLRVCGELEEKRKVTPRHSSNNNNSTASASASVNLVNSQHPIVGVASRQSSNMSISGSRSVNSFQLSEKNAQCSDNNVLDIEIDENEVYNIVSSTVRTEKTKMPFDSGELSTISSLENFSSPGKMASTDGSSIAPSISPMTQSSLDKIPDLKSI